MDVLKLSRVIFYNLIIFAVGIVSCDISSIPDQKPHFVIQPESGLVDEVVKFQVLGLEPGQEITLIASTCDADDYLWESRATFIADNEGMVDLSVQAPISGTYTTIDPMGLFWSMLQQAKVSELNIFSTPEEHYYLVNLVAEIEGKEVATEEIKRTIFPENVTQSMVTENGLLGELYVPKSAGKYPALIILGGSGGGLPSQNASLIASHGYAAFALAYFGIPPLPSTLTEIPLEYFKTAIDWLKTQEKVDQEKIGVIGVSRGGELALLLGSIYPDIKVVVSYVGSGVVRSNLGKDDFGKKSAWTYKGEPIPFLSNTLFLYNTEQATIPVEKINGAVLLISGRDDHLALAPMNSEIAFARLAENDHPYPYKHLAYDDAGHLIGAPFWPTTAKLAIEPGGTRLSLGGTPEGNAFANSDSWLRLFEFLEANLTNTNQ